MQTLHIIQHALYFRVKDSLTCLHAERSANSEKRHEENQWYKSGGRRRVAFIRYCANHEEEQGGAEELSLFCIMRLRTVLVSQRPHTSSKKQDTAVM